MLIHQCAYPVNCAQLLVQKPHRDAFAALGYLLGASVEFRDVGLPGSSLVRLLEGMISSGGTDNQYRPVRGDSDDIITHIVLFNISDALMKPR